MLVNQRAAQLQCRFIPPIAYGNTLDLGAWTPFVFGSPTIVTGVTVSGGDIVLTLPSPLIVSQLDFAGPPPIFRAVDTGILRSFSEPVPFP